MESNKSFFDKFSDKASAFTGSATAFIVAASFVIIWAVTGPIFKYSDTWQMIINTGTTIITFLMVFLIQKAQNKDSKAIQIKLNELIAAHEKASNRIVDIEDLTEKELDKLTNTTKNFLNFLKKMTTCTNHILLMPQKIITNISFATNVYTKKLMMKTNNS